MKISLLEDVLNVLKKHNRTSADVKWVGCETHKTTWENFEQLAASHFTEVVFDLLIVGNGWFLTRAYDDFDDKFFWKFIKVPIEPTRKLKLISLYDENTILLDNTVLKNNTFNRIKGFKLGEKYRSEKYIIPNCMFEMVTLYYDSCDVILWKNGEKTNTVYYNIPYEHFRKP